MDAVIYENRKVYIDGVRRISWDTGEMCEFASAFVSAMRSLGEEIPYAYVMGTSGAAFRFTLEPGEWNFGNYSIRNLVPDEYEPVRRAFAAAGVAYSQYGKGALEEDTARITASIQRGAPALAFGVVGPSDCCVIAGYDEGGEVLMGWSTYQDIPQDHNIPHDPTGYFRKPGWHDNLKGYALIGKKVPRPPLRDIYLEALKWGVYLLRTPDLRGMATGLEGLRVWADEMNQARYFPEGDEETIGWRYVSVAINLTMLRDHCLAAPFLRQAAADVPEFQPGLAPVIACYEEVQRQVDALNEIISDNFSEKAMQAIHDPQMRRAYSEVILRIRDIEAEAAGHLEQFLARCA